jgi:prolyl-tRNA editing enzyme YbaK/EbsC (Cys-tRNA(Pro) deacylase)
VQLTMGDLEVVPARDRPDLLAPAVASALAALTGPVFSGSAVSGSAAGDAIGVAEIDPELADTAAFCERYGVGLAESANCVVISGRRGGETRFAACVVLATTRADVNGAARRELDVRKASFAPMDVAVAETGMEYGGITPVGLPTVWPILVDARVAAAPAVVIGSGLRRSKLVLPGAAVAHLPGAIVIPSLAR